MRRAIATVLCICITTPALADPDPPPPADADAPQPPPPADVTPRPAPPAPSTYVPPPTNPALPVVTVSTMPVPIYARDPDTEPRTAAWIMTGVTAAFGVAVELWWLHRDKFELTRQPANTDPNCTNLTGAIYIDCEGANEYQKSLRKHYQRIWNWTEGGLMSAMGLSAFVTGYLWSRHFHSLHRVGFVPATNGGTVSIGSTF